MKQTKAVNNHCSYTFICETVAVVYMCVHIHVLMSEFNCEDKMTFAVAQE